MNLQNRSIVLGVTGGIAAYKAAALCSGLVKVGALVDVVMTAAAQEFVAPLTFQALTHRPVVTEMFSLLAETEIGHVSLGKRADLLIIAPATANTLAKLAAGIADNMLTSTALACRAPMLIAPAMESQMWANPLTQENVRRLVALRDVTLVGPAEGRLASGAAGVGRMVEPEAILDTARWLLGRGGPLQGRHVLVSAGGTREALDPVRFLGNRSSGKMGHALARAARDRGAEVTLVTTAGPANLAGVAEIPVDTAAEMHNAVMNVWPSCDVLIMAAAVADYRPATKAGRKIKKGDGPLTLELERTEDILAAAGRARRPGQVLVGFAAETEELIQNAQAKLQKKGLDLIVANNARLAMGGEENQVTLLAADNSVEHLPLLNKDEVAERILDRLSALL